MSLNVLHARVKPFALTLICCDPCSIKLPPPLVLLLANCCSTWPMLNPYDTSFSGSSLIWYSFVGPPKLETSTTPVTPLNDFSSTQSSSDFFSITSYAGLVLSTVYQ